MLELITVKEYSRREKISETASRKRLAQSLVQSTQLDGITYIVYINNTEQIIKDLKNKIKHQREQIARYKQASEFYVNQELKIKELEQDLKEYVTRDRNLYEKVIGQFDKMLLPGKD